MTKEEYQEFNIKRRNFELSDVWEEPYTHPFMSGYKYTMKYLHAAYPLHRLFHKEDYDDILSAAFEAGYTAWLRGSKDDEIFRVAKNATLKEFRFLMKPYLCWWQLKEREQEKLDELPILPIARLIYSKLRKKGKRGMRSTILKAFILQQRLVGLTFRRIAQQSESMNSYHRMTIHNVKKHYQGATALIFNIKRGNITR